MSVASNALCSLDNVKDYLIIQGARDADESLIESLINNVSTLFESYCGRTFASGSYTEYFSTDGGDIIFPEQYPIISITSLHDDTNRTFDSTTLVAATNYVSVYDRYIQLIDTVFSTNGVQNVKLIYVGGYATTPGDLKQACIEEVARRYWNQAKNKQLGITAKTMTDGSTTINEDPFLPQVKFVLDLYRKSKV